jgi:hypothetical protein
LIDSCDNALSVNRQLLAHQHFCWGLSQATRLCRQAQLIDHIGPDWSLLTAAKEPMPAPQTALLK